MVSISTLKGYTTPTILAIEILIPLKYQSVQNRCNICQFPCHSDALASHAYIHNNGRCHVSQLTCFSSQNWGGIWRILPIISVYECYVISWDIFLLLWDISRHCLATIKYIVSWKYIGWSTTGTCVNNLWSCTTLQALWVFFHASLFHPTTLQILFSECGKLIVRLILHYFML